VNIPRVSIVIPSYNHANYIAEAIESAINQTYTNIEIIIIDDGSSDDSLYIIENYANKDPRIQVISQPNTGSHATINRGISLARGGFIAILNSDDRFTPSRIDRLLSVCEKRNLDFVSTGITLINAKGKSLTDEDHWWVRMYEGFRDKLLNDGALRALFFGNYTVSTSNFFFRRELYGSLGPLRNLRYVLDWDYAFQALLSNPDKYDCLIDEPLLDYRLHGKNTITSGVIRSAIEANRMLVRYGALVYPDAEHLLRQIQRNLRFQRHQVRERDSREHNAAMGQLRNELQAINEELQIINGELRTVIDALEKNVAGIQNDLNNTRSDKLSLEIKYDEIVLINQDIATQNHNLRNYIQHMSASRSYRLGRSITAPFRWMQKILRHNGE